MKRWKETAVQMKNSLEYAYGWNMVPGVQNVKISPTEGVTRWYMTSTFTINVNLKHSIISLPITSHGNEPQPYHTLDCCSGQQPFGAFIHWTLETPYKASCVVTPGCCVTSAAGEEWHSPTSAAGEEWHSLTRPYCTVASHTSAWSNLMQR